MAFCVTVYDCATYWFPEGVTKEEAKNQAWDWFNERKPVFEVKNYESTSVILYDNVLIAPVTHIHPSHETK